MQPYDAFLAQTIICTGDITFADAANAYAACTSLPAVGVQRSEDSRPGLHILHHGSLLGAGGGIAPRQLAELSCEAVLDVQSLGIALACLVLLQRLHLCMRQHCLLGVQGFCVS